MKITINDIEEILKKAKSPLREYANLKEDKDIFELLKNMRMDRGLM